MGGGEKIENSPLRLTVKQGTGRVDVHHLLVDEGTVPFLRVLLGRVPEEPTADGLLDPHSSFPTRHHVQLVSEKMTGQLLNEKYLSEFD